MPIQFTHEQHYLRCLIHTVSILSRKQNSQLNILYIAYSTSKLSQILIDILLRDKLMFNCFEFLQITRTVKV